MQMPLTGGTSDRGIAYRRIGNGRPLLLIHGWCLNWRMWMYAEEALSDGFEIISCDLAGFGLSSQLAGPYSLRRHADDLAALIADLRLADVTLVGFAFGACVALELAGRPDSSVAAVVSVAIPSAEHSPYAKMADSIRQDWPDFARRSAEALFHARPSDATLRWIEAQFVATALPVALEVLGILAGYRPAEPAARVPVPMLFVHARNDRVAPVSVGETCAGGREWVQLCVLASGGHFVPFEQKDALHDAIRTFVARLPSGRGRA